MLHKKAGLGIQLHCHKAAAAEHVGKAMLWSPWLSQGTTEMRARTLVWDVKAQQGPQIRFGSCSWSPSHWQPLLPFLLLA